jgi:oligopeptide/dipeptide ABC transporter ATP-binding protein
MATGTKARSVGPVLEVDDLRVSFAVRGGGAPVSVVEGLSFSLSRGEALAVVGESGSGKSVSMRALLNILPPTAARSGRAILRDDAGEMDLLGVSARRLRTVAGRRVAMVFQNAMEAMNPTIPLERQLTEHLIWHGICDGREAKRRAVQALGDVGIPEPERRVRMYPFQLSGGMRQRAMIAMAMITNPEVLIADEPTTAVDVTVQRQILDLIRSVKERGTAVVMITHDLGVVRYLCDRAIVLYAGRVMESGPVDELLDRPRHPYTKGLLGSALDVGDRQPLRPIPGNPPDLARRPVGCPFHPRCPEAERPGCEEPQVLADVGNGRTVACWRADAPEKVVVP